jgi:hypothetical protein
MVKRKLYSTRNLFIYFSIIILIFILLTCSIEINEGINGYRLLTFFSMLNLTSYEFITKIAIKQIVHTISQ